MPVADLLNVIRRAKPLTLKEGLAILERDQFRCRYCGLDGLASFENSLVMSVDFVVPRARGGKKDARNLVAACRPCNVIKGRRSFSGLDDAKAYVDRRRAELRQQWQDRVAKIKPRSATA